MIFLFLILFVPSILLLVLYFFINSDSLTIGTTGFIQKVLTRGSIGLLALILSIVCIVKALRPKTARRKRILLSFVVLIAVPAAYFLIKPVVLDIPYLKAPEMTYLERLDFHESYGYGDAMTRYYLRGVDINGENHSFRISKKRLDEGRKQWSETDYRLFAEISYLPHTSTLMSLAYTSNPDLRADFIKSASSSLPERWDSFCVQIGERVYELPTPITTFLKDGWKVSEEDAGMKLAGIARPDASYEWEWITLTDEQEEKISVCVYNTTEETLSVEESIVGGIHVLYGNYDFAGTKLRIPGGWMLGWSTADDILASYGEPDDRFDYSSGGSRISYRNNNHSVPGYWHFEFDEEGILRNIMLHHQAYRPSN